MVGGNDTQRAGSAAGLKSRSTFDPGLMAYKSVRETRNASINTAATGQKYPLKA